MIHCKIIKMYLLCGCTLRKCVFSSIRYKHIVPIIIFFVFSAVSHLVYTLLKQVICCISIVRSLTVSTPEITDFSQFHAIQIVDQMLFKIWKCKSRLSIMCINCIKFIRIKDIIISAASDGTNPFQNLYNPQKFPSVL